ncbi:MAG: zinc-dependent metalloprotease [Casimicrobiaceae bacterium]
MTTVVSTDRAARWALVAIVTALVAALVSGCATLPPGREPSRAASSSDIAEVAAAVAAATSTTTPPAPTAPGVAPRSNVAVAAAAAVAAAQGQSRSFVDVVKDAKEVPGFFPICTRDDKVWIEIAPERLDQAFFFQLNNARGIGEKGVYGGMMGLSHVARFKKIGNYVQLIARNYRFAAKEGTPMARMVREGFSDSLLGAAAVASQPHPERKSILIEANALLLADFAAETRFAQGVHQRGYVFDQRNSSIERSFNNADQLSFFVLAHYTSPKAGLPPAPASSSASNPFPRFENLPDPRSLFLGLQYSFAKVPEPMRPRLADPRIGHFTDEVWDFTDDQRYTARKNYISRWRLEKKDPSAALSEPVQPIVYWIDRNVPEKYRGAVREGILEWNKAFEKIGFANALRAEVQPDDADFETSDARHATVRWFVATDTGFAIGPSHTDPRSGEILDADVAIPDIWARGDRRFIREDVAGLWPAVDSSKDNHGRDARYCTYAHDALAEMEFGLDLLVERGDIEPDSPEADAYVLASLKSVVMHEVGHTLGMRHNFRASTIYPLDKLSDRMFTREHGLSGSVMDYSPVNLALKGELQGEFHQSVLGPYDFWAIEYAYKPIDPSEEKGELARIAGRGASNRLLAFSSDEEVVAGMDPAASHWDFGDEPLAFLERRFKLTSELWRRLQRKELAQGQAYDSLRRSFDAGLRQTVRAAQTSTKYIAGVAYVRDFAGSGRNPLTPVAPEKQRAALKLLADGIFSTDSFKFEPEFMQRMGVDYLQVQWPNVNPDFSLIQRVLALQSGALAKLMSDATASRLLDSEVKTRADAKAFRLSELYTTLHGAIWSELKTGRDIDLFRRNLQREHTNRVASALLRSAASMPADARALLRVEAKTLRTEIAAAQKRSSYSPEAKAHLVEALATLDEALRAPLVRQSL